MTPMPHGPRKDDRRWFVQQRSRRILAEKAQRGEQVERGMRRLGAGCARLLGKLLACRVDRDRQVHVRGRRMAEQPLQHDLARGRIDEIRAAHHFRDALLGIVRDDRELVGVEPVGPLQHEVADFRRDILAQAAVVLVVEDDVRIERTHAP